jgi:hypothetical protein
MSLGQFAVMLFVRCLIPPIKVDPWIGLHVPAPSYRLARADISTKPVTAGCSFLVPHTAPWGRAETGVGFFKIGERHPI